MVQWLRLCTPNAQVKSLVRELKSHMQYGVPSPAPPTFLIKKETGEKNFLRAKRD